MKEVEKILRECQKGNFIFRGEDQEYKMVSSSLYREYGDILENISILEIEKEIAEKARKHFGTNASHVEIMTELQHYGGNTALIDFTQNILIALFFACDGNHDKDGRIIKINTSSLPKENDMVPFSSRIENSIIEPPGKNPRIIFQSSVFVHSPWGYLEKSMYDVIKVESRAKNKILDYLKRSFNISNETIYNDIQGFIRNQGTYTPGALQSRLAGKIKGGKGEIVKKTT